MRRTWSRDAAVGRGFGETESFRLALGERARMADCLSQCFKVESWLKKGCWYRGLRFCGRSSAERRSGLDCTTCSMLDLVGFVSLGGTGGRDLEELVDLGASGSFGSDRGASGEESVAAVSRSRGRSGGAAAAMTWSA